MAVTEVLNQLGEFEFELATTVPRHVLDTIQYFGHIALIPGRVDPKQYGDSLLTAARYVGVVRRKTLGDDGRTNKVQDNIRIGGVGMAFWLGDEDGKGDVYETAQTFSAQGFSTVITALLPDAVTAGTFGTVAGTYTGSHQYETPRSAIQYVCDVMSTTSVPVTWRVNGDGTLDAGPHTDLFVTDPKCLIVRKGTSPGEDMFVRSLQGNVDYEEDMEDFSTRVVLLGEGSGDTFATGTADINTDLNPFKDVHGNALKLTRLQSESDTLEANADARAAIALNTYSSSNKEFGFTTRDYDVHGTFDVGDYVYVYDPDLGLVDTDNEVHFRGTIFNPVKVQVTESTWSITEDFTVAYRAADGTWTDLTDSIHFEEVTDSKVVIGDPSRKLINTSGDSPLAIRSGITGATNSTIPDAPTWVTASFETDVYLDGLGIAKARQTLVWNEPLNTDSTAIDDGSFYEIQYQQDGDTNWQSQFVGWGDETTDILGLSTGVDYNFKIRAVDTGGNQSEFSTTETETMAEDDIAPSTPAAPTVAANTMAFQITHTLGKASGGTYNLENDLAYLEVHFGTASNFTPTATGTLAGKAQANYGMLVGHVPVIETFQVDSTSAVWVKVIAVDMSGNRSAASTGASATAELVDSAHISDLSVTKLTAGTLSANVLLGASIRTASSGQRVELNSTGLHGYNSSGTELVTLSASTGQLSMKTANSGARVELTSSGFKAFDSSGDETVFIDSSDGSVSIVGYLSSGSTGNIIEINPPGATQPEIRFKPDTSSSYAYITVFDDDEVTDFTSNPIVISSNVWTGDGGDGVTRDMESRIWMASGPFSGINFQQIVDDSVTTDFQVNLESIQLAATSLDGTSATTIGIDSTGMSVFTDSSNGDISLHGRLYADNWYTGRSVIDVDTSVPNRFGLTISGFGLPSGDYSAFVTPDSGRPDLVQSHTVNGVSNDSLTAWIYRTNNDDTGIFYMLRERD